MYRSAVIHRRYVPAGCVDCLGCLGLSERPFLAFSAELFNRETAIELFYSEQCVHTIARNCFIVSSVCIRAKPEIVVVGFPEIVVVAVVIA